ncbi:MAG: hypothetical protein U0835_21205 [Isosphaeraceae bacterium]
MGDDLRQRLTGTLGDLDRGDEAMIDLLATPRERLVHGVVRGLLAAEQGPPPGDAELWWTLLNRGRAVDRFRSFFGLRAPSADAVRLHKNLCHRFAAGMAAASALRVARRNEPDAWQSTLTWLSRTLVDSPPRPIPIDPPETSAPLPRPSRLILQAWERLAGLGVFDPRALAYRRDHALLWLDHGRHGDHEFGGGLSELEVVHTVNPPVGGFEEHAAVGFLCRLHLERLADSPAIVAAGPELTEHPAQWWRPLGRDLIEAVEEGWLALAEGESVPARWRITVDDPSREALPLSGRSLSAAAHAGFRLLARGIGFREDSLILAEVRRDDLETLRPVKGVAPKIEAAASGAARGSIRYAFHAATLPHDDRPTPEQRERWKRDASLEVIEARRIGEVLEHVGQAPAVTAYLEWVAAVHGKLRVLGIPGMGAAPTADLDMVYAALRGYETQPGEFRAQIQLMQEARERAPEKARRLFGIELKERDVTPEEREQLQVMLTPMIFQHAEADRLARRRRPEDAADAPELNLGEAFATHRRLVILGDPGSGKTTLVRWLARHLADALRLPDDGRKRLLVPRCQVDPNRPDDTTRRPRPRAAAGAGPRVGTGGGPAEARERREELPGLAECLARPRWDGPPESPRGPLEARAVARVILDAIEDGRAVVLIDGLDEVTTAEDRRALLDAVDRFLARSASAPGAPSETGGNQVVVTSRVVGYWANPVSPELAPTTFTVLPMGRPAVEHFCRSWSAEVARQRAAREGSEFDPAPAAEQAERLIRAVFDGQYPARAVLAGNPLLLTIMAAAFHRDGNLPGRRVELYRLTVDYLLDVWGAPAAHDGAGRETTWRVLGALAERIHESSPNNMLHVPDARGVIAREYQAAGKTPADAERLAESFLDNARLHIGILVEVSPGVWRFQHQNVQEYLAARHLVARGAEGAVRAFLERQDNPRWRESLRMALGYASDHMDAEDLRTLLDALLGGSGDALAGVLPRGALLVVDSLGEMNPARVPAWLWKEAAERLLTAYSDRAGMGRFAPLRARIESTLADLHRLWPPSGGMRTVNGLEAFLTAQLHAPGRAPVVAELIRRRKWSSYRLVRELYEARRHDHAPRTGGPSTGPCESWPSPPSPPSRSPATPSPRPRRPRPAAAVDPQWAGAILLPHLVPWPERRKLARRGCARAGLDAARRRGSSAASATRGCPRSSTTIIVISSNVSSAARSSSPPTAATTATRSTRSPCCSTPPWARAPAASPYRRGSGASTSGATPTAGRSPASCRPRSRAPCATPATNRPRSARSSRTSAPSGTTRRNPTRTGLTRSSPWWRWGPRSYRGMKTCSPVPDRARAPRPSCGGSSSPCGTPSSAPRTRSWGGSTPAPWRARGSTS